MFESLNEKLAGVFKKLKGHGKLSEDNINGVLREIRLALLEADVNFRVVKDFVETLRERAIGQEVLKSLTPAQQVIKETEFNRAFPHTNNVCWTAGFWQNDYRRESSAPPFEEKPPSLPSSGGYFASRCS